MQIDSFQAHSETDDPLLTPFTDDLLKSFLMSSDVSVQKIARAPFCSQSSGIYLITKKRAHRQHPAQLSLLPCVRVGDRLELVSQQPSGWDEWHLHYTQAVNPAL